MLDGEFGTGSTRVRVKGLSRTVRALERAGADSGDMRTLMHDLGMIVVRRARTPERTGRLRMTLKAGRGRTKAVVRAGGARAPYAGVIHYGWPARNIEPNPFLVRALQVSQNDVLRALDDGLGEILRRADLQ